MKGYETDRILPANSSIFFGHAAGLRSHWVPPKAPEGLLPRPLGSGSVCRRGLRSTLIPKEIVSSVAVRLKDLKYDLDSAINVFCNGLIRWHPYRVSWCLYQGTSSQIADRKRRYFGSDARQGQAAKPWSIWAYSSVMNRVLLSRAGRRVWPAIRSSMMAEMSANSEAGTARWASISVS